MKKTIMFMLLVLSVGINAQKYVPFPTENAQWNIHYKNWTSGSGLQSFIEAYVQQGDTTINNLSYKKIYLQTQNGTELTTRFIGGIREENKCIYWLDYYYRGNLNGVRSLTNEQRNCIKQQIKSSAGEMILYNFNKKNIGDTLYSIDYHSGKIMAIDSVLIQNIYRKRYAVQSYTQTISQYSYDYIIEGIGSVREGLLSVVIPILACSEPPLWEFVCFSQNGESIYKNPAYIDCGSTKRWSEVKYLNDNTCWTNYYHNKYQYYLSGDTLINGITYKKLYQRYVNSQYGKVVTEYYTSLREASGKIYASSYNRNNTNYGEYLLYDFSAEIGDTIKSNITSDCGCNLSHPQVVTGISTVTLQNGEKRKKYALSYSSEWIEGIGSLGGFFFDASPLCTCLEQPQLICYKQNDSYLFSNNSSWGGNCDFINGLDYVKTDKQAASLSSNPLVTSSNLKWNLSNNYSILGITDLVGKSMFTINVSGLSEYKINRSDLSKGLYIIQLSSKDGKQASLKLIVE